MEIEVDDGKESGEHNTSKVGGERGAERWQGVSEAMGALPDWVARGWVWIRCPSVGVARLL